MGDPISLPDAAFPYRNDPCHKGGHIHGERVTLETRSLSTRLSPTVGRVTMRIPFLHNWWCPILLCVLVADLNFWFYASMGSNEADYLGILFFVLYGIYCLQSLITRGELRGAVSGLGAVLALALMVMRETGVFDRGYIPPYVMFIVFVMISHGLDRSSRSKAGTDA